MAGHEAVTRGGDPAAPLVTYAQSQLEIMMSSANNLDTQGVGLMAFNGAVMAIVAASRTSLGPVWWIPILILAISVVMCLRVLTGPRDGVTLGIALASAVTAYAGLTEAQINATLLTPLVRTLDGANELVERKTRYVAWAVVLLIVATLAAAICAGTG